MEGGGSEEHAVGEERAAQENELQGKQKLVNTLSTKLVPHSGKLGLWSFSTFSSEHTRRPTRTCICRSYATAC